MDTIIIKAETIELSEDDIVRICRGKVNIWNVMDLANVNKIDELFQHNDPVVLFWAVNSKDEGHFNTLLRHYKENKGFRTIYYEFYDSYSRSIQEIYDLS